MKEYSYYPGNAKKLRLNEVLYRMRDLRLLYYVFAVLWVFWSCFFLADISVLSGSGAYSSVELNGMITVNWILIYYLCFNTAAFFLIRWLIRRRDDRARIASNAMRYFPLNGPEYIEALRQDLSRGLRFIKRRNIAVSESFIIASLSRRPFDPVAIPIEMIKLAAFETGPQHWSHSAQRMQDTIHSFVFFLTNNAEVQVYINDTSSPELPVTALEEAGIPVTELAAARGIILSEQMHREISGTRASVPDTPADAVRKQPVTDPAAHERHLRSLVLVLADSDKKQITALLDADEKLRAVNYFRQHSRASLAEIKEITDNREKYFGAPPPESPAAKKAPPPASKEDPEGWERNLQYFVSSLSEEDRDQIISLLDSGDKLKAVRYFREHSRAGLIHIREIVENREKYLGR